MIRALVWAAVLVGAQAAVAEETANEKVLAFAKSQVGKQVGNGECWTLANEAVKAAGAKSSFDFADAPNKGDYVWGDFVYGLEAKAKGETGALKDVKPGDVVQFRDAKFVARQGNRTTTTTASHHTAVVLKADRAAKTITVLHQNWSGNKTVAEATLPLAGLQAGWIKVYRPVAK
jgi:hypothetical protein